LQNVAELGRLHFDLVVSVVVDLHPGTDVIAFKILSPKKIGKKLALFRSNYI
jgi:hypothetical protein